MRTKISVTLFSIMLVISCFSMAQRPTKPPTPSSSVEKVKMEKSKKSDIDWVQLVFAGSILIGVFALFPIVVYTNLHEKLVDVEANPEKRKPIHDSLENREQHAVEILNKIEESLTPYVDENGEELITITKGKQARLMKRGLDYINIYLVPEEEAIKERVAEFTTVYIDRTERIYSGSNWILGCAIGLLVFMGLVDTSILLSSFALIHVVGILFYYTASRVPKYILDKRLKRFGSNRKGFVGLIISTLFAGAAVKHYVSVNGGAWERDYESEGMSSILFIFLALMAALFIGFFIALFGILNFLMNYITNFILPFPTDEKWHASHFENNTVVA